MLMIAACSLLRAPVLTADDAAADSVDHQVMLLERQLRSDRQSDRVQAQRELTALGRTAIPGIERAVQRAGLEQLPYLISALERMFVAGCPPEADEAEQALVRLAEADRPAVSGRAIAVLFAHQLLREQRAVAALRELGADVLYDDVDRQAPVIVGPLGTTSGIVIPGHELAKIEVWLHDDIAGGEEALWHVTRLEHNWSVRTCGITVYNIDGNGISTAAVHGLAARLHNANIQERGDVCLGISCGTTFGCLITEALPGGTAAAAGLGEGDEILEIDGEPVPTFGHLVNRLRQRSPGDSATLKYRHYDNEPVEIEVTLGSWRPVVESHKAEIEAQSRDRLQSFPDRFPFAPDLPVK
jgi:hypothetical protein